MLLTADFETTTKVDDCRVWAWGLCEIGNPLFFKYGTNIDEMMEILNTEETNTIYFHNLAFDGTFILVWLFEHGYHWVEDRRDLTSQTFTTLISNRGQFYSMEIMFKRQGKHHHKLTIYDSLKILPFSVDDVAKGFKLPLSKIEKEQEFYTRERPIDHKLTTEEIEYLNHDVVVMSMALNVLFAQGLTKMTQGSNALFDYKRTIGQKRFDRAFPTPDYDYDVRLSYRGGFTYLDKRWANKDIKDGIVLDVNSLYPSVMRNRPLPYGNGLYFKGEYEKDDLYPLYVQSMTFNFKLKPNHIPTIQIKRNTAFMETEYLTSSNGEDVTLVLTSVDLALIKEHYYLYNVQYHDGWKFKQTTGLFVEYIDKWTKVKTQSKIDGNFAMYMLAKLMLNALYGKFATNPNVQSKIPYYDDGYIKYRLGEKEQRKPLYIPVGTFVTAWARYTTITAAQKLYDRFIYADTDSLHLIGTELPEELEISDTALGAWKHEATFKRARFIRQKTYFECHIVTDKEYSKMGDADKEKCYTVKGVRVVDKITCAGMPKSCYKHVTWDNFHPGLNVDGKLQRKSVRGGIVLKEGDFTIKKGLTG